MTITWGRDGDTAFVAVLDSGPGLSAEDAAAAFQRFQRGSARPAGGGGTGLGLAIVGALAARWGGSASLEARAEGVRGRRYRSGRTGGQRCPYQPITQARYGEA